MLRGVLFIQFSAAVAITLLILRKLVLPTARRQPRLAALAMAMVAFGTILMAGGDIVMAAAAAVVAGVMAVIKLRRDG